MCPLAAPGLRHPGDHPTVDRDGLPGKVYAEFPSRRDPRLPRGDLGHRRTTDLPSEPVDRAPGGEGRPSTGGRGGTSEPTGGTVTDTDTPAHLDPRLEAFMAATERLT